MSERRCLPRRPRPTRRTNRPPARLARLLDGHGAAAVESALADALARGAVSAASVAHLLDQRTRARKAPPPIAVVLPDDPRVRDLRVTPHTLTQYDALSEETPMTTTPLADQLANLGLRHAAAHLDDLIATATKKRLAPLEIYQ